MRAGLARAIGDAFLGMDMESDEVDIHDLLSKALIDKFYREWNMPSSLEFNQQDVRPSARAWSVSSKRRSSGSDKGR